MDKTEINVDISEDIDAIHKYLACSICNRIAYIPTRIIICAHTFCENCIRHTTTCPECKVLFRAQDLAFSSEHDHMTKCFLQIVNILNTPNEPVVTEKSSSKVETSNSVAEECLKICLPNGLSNCLPPTFKIFPAASREDMKKKNSHGETKLHVACIKGNVNTVQDLVHLTGVNITDNYGWTPLHEAAKAGHTAVCKILLAAGAIVNVPSANYNTPLHLAVEGGRCDTIRLLRSYGASLTATSYEGNIPVDLSSDTVEEALTSTVSIQLIRPVLEDLTNIQIYCDNKFEYNENLSSLGIKFDDSIGTKTTHYVSCTDSMVCDISLGSLKAILQGIWIVNINWYQQCLKEKRVINPETYEVSGTMDFPKADGPKKARLCKQLLGPGLFHGCFMFVFGNTYKSGNLVLTRKDVIDMILLGGGKLLARCPSPEFIPKDKIYYPYHTAGKLQRCAHYIIYMSQPKQPEYRFAEMHTLPLSWLIQCIQLFQLAF